MSTDQQQYSIDNQREGISRYALEHSMEIVKTYSDAAKSGLSLQNRPGLKPLLADVESGSPGYSGVLVYDVSRWDDSRMQTKVPSTNIVAAGPRSRCVTVPRHSRTIQA
jgi:DNA invertase Pin-like site-specific DNA recombinase